MGIEHIKELVDQSVKNVKKDNPDLLKEERIKLLGESVAYVFYSGHYLDYAFCSW